MRCAGHVGLTGEGSYIHSGVNCRGDMAVVVKYNIKLDLKVIGWEGVECSDLAKDTVKWRTGVKEVMKTEGNFLTNW